MSNPSTSKKKKAAASPDPQVVAEIRERYFTWLIKRETKRLQGQRGHWVGKKVPTAQA